MDQSPKSWNSNYEIASGEHKRKHLGPLNSGNQMLDK